VLAVDVDERVHPGEAAEAYVRRLAEKKSAAALRTLERRAPSAERRLVRASPASPDEIGTPNAKRLRAGFGDGFRSRLGSKQGRSSL